MTIGDWVMISEHSLYAELVDEYGLADDTITALPRPIDAVTCRWMKPAKPRYLESSYEETCAAVSSP